MAVTSDGKLYGWGWNKVIILTCLVSKLASRFNAICDISSCY